MNFLRSLLLKNLHIPSNIWYAPLAGCSDYPFRKMTSQFTKGLKFCEMVKMEALLRGDMGTFRLLDFDASMHPIGAQLCGSNPSLAAPSARILEDLGFDSIDLNCGCPVDKVTKDGSGSGLLKNPKKIGDMVANLVSSTSLPVTIKIRTGWDEDSIVANDLVKIAQEAGAKAITIHGRTREQAYKGLANRERIQEAKKEAHSILVFGNGDILTKESAKEMFLKTNCDGILLARATLGKPWIGEEIRRFLENEPPLEITTDFIKEVFLEHFRQILLYETKRKATLSLRRVGCWYLREAKGAKALREQINHIKDPLEVLQIVEKTDFSRIEWQPEALDPIS